MEQVKGEQIKEIHSKDERDDSRLDEFHFKDWSNSKSPEIQQQSNHHAASERINDSSTQSPTRSILIKA